MPLRHHYGLLGKEHRGQHRPSHRHRKGPVGGAKEITHVLTWNLGLFSKLQDAPVIGSGSCEVLHMEGRVDTVVGSPFIEGVGK